MHVPAGVGAHASQQGITGSLAQLREHLGVSKGVVQVQLVVVELRPIVTEGAKLPGREWYFHSSAPFPFSSRRHLIFLIPQFSLIDDVYPQ
jgi:small ligand-binding sensory domain FIST